jgi:hypothetical protein
MDKIKGSSQAVATGNAVTGSIRWDEFTSDQLQHIQKEAQSGRFGRYLEDWLRGDVWLNDPRLLHSLGYDIDLVWKRLTPGIDEVEPIGNWGSGSICFQPMLESGSAPFAIHYKHILSKPLGLHVYIGLQSLKLLAESGRLRESLFPSKGFCRRIFAPKSAYQTNNGESYVLALHLDDLSIKPFSFNSILGQEDWTVCRR